MREKGITLIALIITIIILIILTAITLKSIVDFSIVGRATEVGEKYVEAGKEEQEKLKEIEDIIEGGYDKSGPYKANLIVTGIPTVTTAEVMAEGADRFTGIYSYTFEKSLSKEEGSYEVTDIIETTEERCPYTYENLEEGRTNYLRVKVTDKEGNTKTSEAVEVLTKVGEPTIIIANKEVWTNGGKNVTISTKEGFKTKYTIDGSNPNLENGIEYKEMITVEKNCKIKAVYISEENIIGKIVEDEIRKIDKLEPNVPTIAVTPGKHSMTIAVTKAEDKGATEENGSSGIGSYRYCCNGTWTGWITGTTYTGFNNIYGNLAGVVCTLQVEVRDNAGNVTKSAVQNKTTTCLNNAFYKTSSMELAQCKSGSAVVRIWRKTTATPCITGIVHYKSYGTTPSHAPFLVSNIANGCAQSYSANGSTWGSSSIESSGTISYHRNYILS